LYFYAEEIARQVASLGKLSRDKSGTSVKDFETSSKCQRRPAERIGDADTMLIIRVDSEKLYLTLPFHTIFQNVFLSDLRSCTTAEKRVRQPAKLGLNKLSINRDMHCEKMTSNYAKNHAVLDYSHKKYRLTFLYTLGFLTSLPACIRSRSSGRVQTKIWKRKLIEKVLGKLPDSLRSILGTGIRDW
jgi:hypothetical protein